MTFWPETPNPRSHTVEVLFEAPDGELVALDLVVVPMRETWAGWFTASGELVRMVEVGEG